MTSATPPRPSTSSLRTPARPSTAVLGPSPAYVGGSRSRHAVYGIDDRIVLDLGSRVWKAGFSGESKPRVVATVRELCGGQDEALRTLRGVDAMTEDQHDERDVEEVVAKERIQNGLRRIFFHHLMADPKQRKVIVVEDPLVPNSIKLAIATVLFDNLSVPSVSFSSAPVLTLMAAGTITGLVVDIGHLETSVIPVFASRPLFPLMRSSVRAGSRLNVRFRALLLHFARYIPMPSVAAAPSGAGSSRPRTSSVPAELLTDEVLEDIKARVCLVGAAPTPGRPATQSETMEVDPIPSTSAGPSAATVYSEVDDAALMASLQRRFASTSSAVPIVYPLPDLTAGSNPAIGSLPKGNLLIPGWIRERAAEALLTFSASEGEDSDGFEDESEGLAEIVLNTVRKLPIDLRRIMLENVVVSGGGAMLPGLIGRLRDDLVRVLRASASVQPATGPRRRRPRSTPRYSSLSALAPHVTILNDPSPPLDAPPDSRAGSAPAFSPALLAWVGGSLAGSIKTGGREVARERWDAVVDEEVAGSALTAAQRAAGQEGPDSDTAQARLELGQASGKERGLRKACGLVPDWTRLPMQLV